MEFPALLAPTKELRKPGTSPPDRGPLWLQSRIPALTTTIPIWRPISGRIQEVSTDALPGRTATTCSATLVTRWTTTPFTTDTALTLQESSALPAITGPASPALTGK